MKNFTCLILITFIVLTADAQRKSIDSIKLLLQQEKTDTGKIQKLISLGDTYWRQNNDSALIYYQEALSWSSRIGFVHGEIKARSNMANFLYYIKLDFATALDFYLQNLKREEETGDTTFIFHDTRDVGLIYGRIDHLEKELEYVFKMRDLTNSEILKNNSKLAIYKVAVDNRLGAVYQKLNKLDSAKYFRSRVFNYGVASNDLQRIVNASIGLGDIYRKLNNRDSAFYYYRVGLTAAANRPGRDFYNNAMVKLASMHWEDRRVDSATYYAQRAFRQSQHSRNFVPMISATEILAEIFYEKNQTDSAYIYLRRFVALKDSIFSTEKVNKVQSLSLNESLRKFQEEQTKKEAVQEYKSRIKVYSLAAGLAGLLILIFILYRNNRQRQVANKKIEKAYIDLKSTQAQLIQSEKMASLGELTAGIAHEIQNPLNFVNNFADVNKELLAEMKQEIVAGNSEEAISIAADIEENEQKIIHHGKRADAIVKGMLQHSRASSGNKEPTHINALADEYLRLSYHGLRAKDKDFNAIFTTNFDASIGNIEVVPQDIGRVLLNLYNNAFYSVNEKKKKLDGVFEPTVSVSTKRIDNNIELCIKDNGTGIPQIALDKIYQPFFTTKPTGEGTGLGLSLSYDIVKAHDGEMKVNTKEGEFAEFTIILPAG
jgi:signal transduction histidine kinase